jgi:peroxiredoxin
MNKAALSGAAVILVAVMGCGGEVSQPQSAKAPRKSQPRDAVERSAKMVPSDEQSTNESKDEVEQPSQSGDGAPLVTQSPTKDSALERGPERVTVLRPTVQPAVMPEVVLSAAHSDDCFVRVGDQFPDFRLPDLAARARTLDEVQGDGLTVAVFWAGDRLAAESQLRYLNDHIARYADLGVRAVAINVGQMPDQVRAAVDALQINVTVLLDLDGRLFARVGKDHLPRTYLLDREGRILWFDIEFSRHTRENLEQAIHASLNST